MGDEVGVGSDGAQSDEPSKSQRFLETSARATGPDDCGIPASHYLPQRTLSHNVYCGGLPWSSGKRVAWATVERFRLGQPTSENSALVGLRNIGGCEDRVFGEVDTS